ncbi:hypothetical protein GIR22_24665 [Pseudomonas sp. CCM 7891]|uniref:Uncharacterized protein n=1 Tax=Pseudomonas karstica TaxID=1055468 RepID=A0A7X2RYL1_9PSED|nr:hypothetical protein [Pseudomonas karstica]MTD22327.1 hypothetical protein [Pseudomonas karstica]
MAKPPKIGPLDYSLSSSSEVLSVPKKSLLSQGGFDALLGKMSDPDVAALARVSVSAVQQRRAALKIHAYVPISRLAAFDQLLGAVPDQDIANIAGVSKAAVTERRTRLGIKSLKRSTVSPLDDYEHLLGKLPDRTVAAMAGVSAGAALKRRRREKIEPYTRGTHGYDETGQLHYWLKSYVDT